MCTAMPSIDDSFKEVGRFDLVSRRVGGVYAQVFGE
jgi:hypothetical protein